MNCAIKFLKWSIFTNGSRKDIISVRRSKYYSSSSLLEPFLSIKYQSGYLSFLMHSPIIASICGLNLSVFIRIINSWYYVNYSHMMLCIFMSSSWKRSMDSINILSKTAMIWFCSSVNGTSYYVLFYITCVFWVFIIIFFSIWRNCLSLKSLSSHCCISLFIIYKSS